MKIETEDYSIETNDQQVIIKGALRLQSPTAYDKPFESIREAITNKQDGLHVDISDLNFLNSSGVTSLARLVLDARKADVGFTLLCSEDIPWQSKTVSSLGKLNPKLTINFK
ncbi:hypothetical protein HOH87_07015 [bacterium]|jgi:hypothetical protein|nr:hypothetical protein [bacterium]